MIKEFKEYLFEQLTSNDCAIFSGRFQPFHTGHKMTIDKALKKYKRVAVIIVEGKGTSKDKNKNPLSFDDRKKLIKKVYPNETKVKVFKAPTAFLGDFVDVIRESGWNPVSLYCGEDRLNSYKVMAKKYGEELALSSFTVEESERFTSATKVRETIKSGDEESFQKLVPSELHNQWEFLRKKIK